MRRSLVASVALLAASAAAAATAAPESDSLLPGGNSKEPISIEADKLVYSDKDSRAIYSGNVIVIQGASKMNCSVLTLIMDKGAAPPQKTASAAPPAAPAADNSSLPGGNSQLRHMDCQGPVRIFSKTQTATGDSASYDKLENKFWIIGNVTLSDGPNVTKGDKLTYDLSTAHATVETGGGKSKSRVQSQFVPGSTSGPEMKARP